MSQVVCKFCTSFFEKSSSEIKRSKTGNHFCSKSCSVTYNNRGRIKNKPKKRLCNNCQSSFLRSASHSPFKYCPSCIVGFETVADLVTAKLKIKTLAEVHEQLAVKGKHKSWQNAQVRGLNRSWNKKLLLKPCAHCGYSKHVELCHKKPISSFDISSTLGEINHPDNIVQLCRNCHWEFDHGFLCL